MDDKHFSTGYDQVHTSDCSMMAILHCIERSINPTSFQINRWENKEVNYLQEPLLYFQEILKSCSYIGCAKGGGPLQASKIFPLVHPQNAVLTEWEIRSVWKCKEPQICL